MHEKFLNALKTLSNGSSAYVRVNETANVGSKWRCKCQKSVSPFPGLQRSICDLQYTEFLIAALKGGMFSASWPTACDCSTHAELVSIHSWMD